MIPAVRFYIFEGEFYQKMAYGCLFSVRVSH